MNHVVRAEEKSGHRPVRSNAVDARSLAGTRARAWNIELSKGAILIPHEAVIPIRAVNIPSRDRSIRIDSKRKGTLVSARPSIRSIERSESAILIPQEAMTQTARIIVI